MISYSLIRRPIVFAFAISFVWQSAASAKAPTLNTLFPAGAQRGQTVEVTAGGEFGNWPPRVWVDGTGVEVTPSSEKGKLAISVAPSAPLSVAWLRLYDDEGASALRPFLVGALPEIMEAEPNDEPSHPQVLGTTSTTVNGRLGRAGDVDAFAVSLRRGQTLVASMEANGRLGSPMDAVLQVVSPQGFVLFQSDDGRGLDPTLVFDAPADGTYLVRTFAFPSTPNQTIAFAGGDTFVYRLTITTSGFVDHALPLAAQRSVPAQVELRGWNIPESARFFTSAWNDLSDLARVELPLLVNSTDVRIVPHPAIVESEPNDPEGPQVVSLPVTITGRIDTDRDRDVFQFSAQKDQKVLIRAESRALGLPLDPVLRLTDSADKVLSDVDDSAGARDPELAFTAPADGAYRLWIRDLNGRGGSRYVYRLTLALPEPDFSLSLATDRVTFSTEKPMGIPIVIDRKNGFAGKIAIRADGLPEGVTAAALTSEPTGDTAKKATLVLTATQTPVTGPFRVVGTAEMAGERTIERPASALLTGILATTPYIWISVVKAK